MTTAFTDDMMREQMARAAVYTLVVLRHTDKYRSAGTDKIIWEHARRQMGLQAEAFSRSSARSATKRAWPASASSSAATTRYAPSWIATRPSKPASSATRCTPAAASPDQRYLPGEAPYQKDVSQWGTQPLVPSAVLM